MLTLEDIKNLIAMLNRTTLQGNEAETVVMLKQKLMKMLEPKKDDKKNGKNKDS